MSGKQLMQEAKKQGWKLDRINGSHYIMVKGDRIASIPVHGSKDLKKGILNKLLKDLGLK